MDVDVRFRHMTATSELRELAQRRASFALDRYQPHIEAVQLRLVDINGDHGGPDKRCQVMVLLHDGHEVIVQHDEANFPAAIASTTTAAKRALRRHLERQRPRRRAA